VVSVGSWKPEASVFAPRFSPYGKNILGKKQKMKMPGTNPGIFYFGVPEYIGLEPGLQVASRG